MNIDIFSTVNLITGSSSRSTGVSDPVFPGGQNPVSIVDDGKCFKNYPILGTDGKMHDNWMYVQDAKLNIPKDTVLRATGVR